MQFRFSNSFENEYFDILWLSFFNAFSDEKFEYNFCFFSWYPRYFIRVCTSIIEFTIEFVSFFRPKNFWKKLCQKFHVKIWGGQNFNFQIKSQIENTPVTSLKIIFNRKNPNFPSFWSLEQCMLPEENIWCEIFQLTPFFV